MVSSAGIITTFAGTGTRGISGDGGAATLALLYDIEGITVDISGNVYFIEATHNNVRKVSSTGIISTYAGTGTGGNSGDGGPATLAQLGANFFAICADISGNMYIGDTGFAKVRKISNTGIIITYAGTGVVGTSGDGSPATSAQLAQPYGLSVDSRGNVYIADNGNNKIRMVSSAGIITTYAGTGTAGSSGDGGFATSAQLNSPQSGAVDSSGNLYILDRSNKKIRLLIEPQPSAVPTATPSRSPTSQPTTQVNRTFLLCISHILIVFTYFVPRCIFSLVTIVRRLSQVSNRHDSRHHDLRDSRRLSPRCVHRLSQVSNQRCSRRHDQHDRRLSRRCNRVHSHPDNRRCVHRHSRVSNQRDNHPLVLLDHLHNPRCNQVPSHPDNRRNSHRLNPHDNQPRNPLPNQPINLHNILRHNLRCSQ